MKIQLNETKQMTQFNPSDKITLDKSRNLFVY